MFQWEGQLPNLTLGNNSVAAPGRLHFYISYCAVRVGSAITSYIDAVALWHYRSKKLE